MRFRLFLVTLVTFFAFAGGALAWWSGALDRNATSSPAVPSGQGASAPASPTPGPAATATPRPSPTAQPAGSTACPNGSLEGCFTYASMGAFLEAIKPLVAQFFLTSYPRVPPPSDIVFVPRGRVAAGACGYSNSAAYEYCPANRTIYIGQDLLWNFYNRHGDAAPIIGLAHEWAHHLQFMRGVRPGQTAAGSVRFENQADCLSGAFARYADEQGWLEEDDLDDVATLLRAIGSRESPYRDHGTAAERAEAFKLGFEGGAKACNSYFPSSPVA